MIPRSNLSLTRRGCFGKFFLGSGEGRRRRRRGGILLLRARCCRCQLLTQSDSLRSRSLSLSLSLSSPRAGGLQIAFASLELSLATLQVGLRGLRRGARRVSSLLSSARSGDGVINLSLELSALGLCLGLDCHKLRLEAGNLCGALVSSCLRCCRSRQPRLCVSQSLLEGCPRSFGCRGPLFERASAIFSCCLLCFGRL